MGKDSSPERIRTEEGDPQMKIRMPKYLKENIEEAAQRNGRSRVAEILFRLKLSLGLEQQDNEQ